MANRFTQLLPTVPVQLGTKKHRLVCDLGHHTTRIACDRTLVYRQPTLALLHGDSQSLVAIGKKAQHYQGQRRLLRQMTVVDRNVPTDFQVGYSYIREIVDHLWRRLHLHWRDWVDVYYIVPSDVTLVEEEICDRVFKSIGFGKWQLVTKAHIWETVPRLAGQHTFLENGIAGVIDIGSKMTEVVFFQSQNVGSGTRRAITIPIGAQSFIELIQLLVKTHYSFEIGVNTAEHMLRQLPAAVLQPADTNSEGQAQLAVRGKDMKTDTPGTVVVDCLRFQEDIMQEVTRMSQQIKYFLRGLTADQFSQVTEQGFLLAGGGSRVAGLRQALSASTGIKLATTPDAFFEDILTRY